MDAEHLTLLRGMWKSNRSNDVTFMVCTPPQWWIQDNCVRREGRGSNTIFDAIFEKLHVI